MTSPRVAPGLLSWAAWEALRSADAVLAPAGHPLLPALDEAGIGYRLADEPDLMALADGEDEVVWLPVPGAESAGKPLPAGARLLAGAPDLPGAHLLEEPYEALEALESGDAQALCEELGDVLLQVAFHARIAAERHDGTGYTIDDVADGIVAKLIRRHPHVFADVTVSGAEDVNRNWDEIKQEEKRLKAERAGLPAEGEVAASALDAVPFGQPALSLAAQLQRRAARAGVPDGLADLDGDPGSDGAADEIGRDLFRLVLKARAAGRDPEMELRAAARRYRDLVRAWERS